MNKRQGLDHKLNFMSRVMANKIKKKKMYIEKFFGYVENVLKVLLEFIFCKHGVSNFVHELTRAFVVCCLAGM